MLLWRRFSADPGSALRFALFAGAVPLGLYAESTSYGWGDWTHAVPDAVTGWTLVGLGVLAWSRRPASGSGLLLAATGVIWFAGNFAAPLLYLHRGPLIHFSLSYPTGRLRRRVTGAAVVVGYVAALAAVVWRSPIATLVLAVLLLFVAAAGRPAARQPAFIVAFVLIVVASVRLVTSDPAAVDATLLLYEAALCALALDAIRTLIGVGRHAQVTDLVVELGEARRGTLRDELAAALGDPSLEVVYPLATGDGYVDASGERVELRPDGPGRRVTRLVADGREVAAIVHDAAVLDDPALAAAAVAAARLAGANARLQAEARERLAELRASRRRLLTIGEDERQRLEQRLREGPAARLAAIGDALEAARGEAGPQARASLAPLEFQLAHVTAELEALAAGLHPRELTEGGLAAALPALTAGSHLRVGVIVPDQRFQPEVEAAVYFTCAEALANADKHAAATGVDVEVTVDARAAALVVQVSDDGAGGASLQSGGGLSGLADRVEALGGSFSVDSTPDAGTCVTAIIPLAEPRQ